MAAEITLAVPALPYWKRVGERHSHAAEINTCPDPYNKFDPIMS
jgi:hypothetical protein